MAETTKTTPSGPLRDPLPPIYPIPFIEVACRALEASARIADAPIKLDNAIFDLQVLAIRIIKDGLTSHERAAQEGRSRG